MKIKHVYGNVLKLDIPLTIKIRTMEGDVPTEREEPFYPDVSKGCAVILGSSYNRKMQYDATVSGNVAHIEDDGIIGIGTYKVTVKCYDEYGNPYRYMVRDIIEICDATIDAGIEAGVEFNAETYTLEGAVFVSYGGGSFEQVQADWMEADIHSKAYIKNKPTNLVEDESYVHTDNNYTDEEKEKLGELENYDDSGIRQELDGKVDKVNGKGLSTNDYTNEDKSKLNSALQSETDPTVPSWAKQPSKPSYTAQEVGALSNSTKYGSTIDLAMDSATYVLTLSLKDQDGTVLNTKTVDLPIESVVVNGRYDAANKKIVLTLQSGSTLDVPVGDLIAGLQTEITSVNMLDADLVDDTNSTHKFVTAQEKQAWNNKSDFSGSYNDLSDKPSIPTALSQLSEDATHRTVSDTEKTTWGNKQEPLVSGTNIKTINNESLLGGGNINIDISGKEDKSNKVASWQVTPDDTHYPSEKLVKDSIDAVDKFVKVEFGVTTYAQVKALLDGGKIPYVIINSSSPAKEIVCFYVCEIYYSSNHPSNAFVFCSTRGENVHIAKLSTINGIWIIETMLIQNTIHLVTTQPLDRYATSIVNYPSTKAVVDYAEKLTAIEAPVNATDATLPITTLSCEVGKYYRIDVAVDTLAVTLPAMTDLTTVRTVVIYLTAGTTPAVTIAAADSKDVYYQDGFEIEAGNTYEINALFNGAAWIVASVKINVE